MGKIAKYKIRKDLKHPRFNLWRIQALKNFSDVKKGDIGGYIEKEENLSQLDNCWVYENAKVHGKATVRHDAQVYGDAQVCGNAKVYVDAKVYGDAWVYENALVCGDARIYNNAEVHGNAKVSGNANVYGNANVSGNAHFYGNAEVYEDTFIYENTKIFKQHEKKEKKVNEVKKMALQLREKIAPYEKYIIMAAVLIAIDYFLLGNKGSDYIKNKANIIVKKLMTIVDKGVNKLLGDLDE